MKSPAGVVRPRGWIAEYDQRDARAPENVIRSSLAHALMTAEGSILQNCEMEPEYSPVRAGNRRTRTERMLKVTMDLRSAAAAEIPLTFFRSDTDLRRPMIIWRLEKGRFGNATARGGGGGIPA